MAFLPPFPGIDSVLISHRHGVALPFLLDAFCFVVLASDSVEVALCWSGVGVLLPPTPLLLLSASLAWSFIQTGFSRQRCFEDVFNQVLVLCSGSL